MTKTLKVILMTALALYAGLCMAEEKANPRSIETLMIKSGLSKQLEQTAPVFKAGLTQQNQESKTLSQEELDELGSIADRALDAKTLKEHVQKHLQTNLSETDIQFTLTWLNSPLGEKITKLEEDASTPAAYMEMQKMSGSLTRNAGRVELVRKLDSAVKATETGVAVALNTQVAIIAALTSGATPEKRPTMEHIEKELVKSKKEIQTIIEKSTLLAVLYAYRSLSDAEITKYIDFARSGSGTKYHTVTSEGINAAMKNAAHVLGDLISQNANKKVPSAVKQQNI